jgi:exodeoxyribonuclease-3
MKIASWNVNSVRARLPIMLDWLRAAKPDVVLLQEIKCEADAFPAMEIEELGYNLAIFGQKSYNGVAILAKLPIEDVQKGLPGDDTDPQARYIEATVGTVRVGSVYLPNGNPAPGEKFDYKLRWMDRLIAHARDLLALDEASVLGGDYNVCPTDDDVADPAARTKDALCRPESRAKFQTLLHLGIYDAFRLLHPNAHRYTYWDYGRAFAADNGLRIDHLMLSPQAVDRLKVCEIDKGPRGQPKASDHTPIWCGLSD